MIKPARGNITNLRVNFAISRPAAVEDRAVPGHWEGDLLSGPNNSYIATLVERHMRYMMLAKLANKEAHMVVSALIKQAKKLPNVISRGTDLLAYSQTHLNKVARQLNEWPRKTLSFETPAERFNACVASTGWAGMAISDMVLFAWRGNFGVMGSTVLDPIKLPGPKSLVTRRAIHHQPSQVRTR